MITVGIQDNIRLIEASKNDKGTLVVKAQQDSGGSGGLLSMLSSTSSQTQENDQDFYFWPIQEDDRLDSDAEKYKDALNKLKTFRAQLNHILEQYMVSTAIHWDPTANLGMTEAELAAGLQDSVKRPLILGGIYSNYVDQFVIQITPHVGPASPLFRMKLPRTSKDKHYASIPKFAPFMEPMTIAKNTSKLKWTPYDLGKRKGDPDGGPFSGVNLSDPTEVAGAAAGVAKGNSKEAADVAHLFGA